ncbi:MAG: A/G-specific DNA-adenine glycosylase [Bacteroidetes bacterium]|nr:A/G-specific DNA-adenine glycosylase [Bacteroidota bacterium]
MRLFSQFYNFFPAYLLSVIQYIILIFVSEVQNKIQILLKEWYQANKRDLPWRDIDNPYKIWISEIILQQTRVNQGYDYYIRFIGRFPDIATLASADEDEVLKYWQGLGYYSRARNLHKAARQIMTRHNGIFPSNFQDVLNLSGVGHYTAAAICSFAYKQPYAVVDGNVYRVLSRLTALETPIDSTVGKKEFAELAQQFLAIQHPDIHNQAMMDFGAMQCTPAYFFITKGNDTYLQKREKNDIWKNLYEFPLIESSKDVEIDELSKMDDFKILFENAIGFKIIKKSRSIKHILSHRIIYTRFYTVRIDEESEKISSFLKIHLTDIDKFAVSRLTELFLEKELHE